MHLHVAYPLFFLLSFLSLAMAAPDAVKQPKPSSTPPKPPKCTKELLCCLDATTPSASAAKTLIGLLHISLTPEQKGEQVGLTCSTLQKRGVGDACFFKTLCCDKSYQSGFIAVGCTVVSA